LILSMTFLYLPRQPFILPGKIGQHAKSVLPVLMGFSLLIKKEPAFRGLNLGICQNKQI